MKVIDVSKFQGEINWNQVSGQMNGAVLRCGYGDNLKNQDDPQYVNNADACTSIGIPFGIYLYSYATSTAAAKSEAEHVLRLASGYRLRFPVYYDLEDEGTVGTCSNEQIMGFMKTFADVVEGAGYWCGVYASKNWFETRLNDPFYNRYTKWVAQHNSKLTYTGEVGMWQYTSQGSIAGIAGNVDLNESFRDFPQLITGEATGGQKPAPEVETDRFYIVQPGDTLSGIAAKFGTTYQKLAAQNGITNPNLIYSGQRIQVTGNAPGGGATVNYTIKSGDTLSGIALKFGTTAGVLQSLNGITNPNKVYAGSQIRLK